jgi:hypothetical protein
MYMTDQEVNTDAYSGQSAAIRILNKIERNSLGSLILLRRPGSSLGIMLRAGHM